MLVIQNINMFTFKHPKYYKELRARNKSDQAISDECATAPRERSPGPGPQAEASSRKRLEATSSKRQATSVKQQA